VAKILVADDNSNIQKMVGLALKDQGIEVIAVGNGEAAVRKAVDLRPDLILADVFMPVRNGYEVCKFVKDDPALSHIPVILLVGAFDPLDEQEAQRVGADGVLKKPFVPPDPLISMVKSALARAGVVLGAASSSTPPPPMPAAARPAAPPIPRIVSPPPPTFTPEPEEEPVAPASFSPRPATLTIDKGAQPLAFGSLLETQTAEDDTVFSVTPVQATPERDWRESAVTDEPEEEEEESKSGSWRLSSIQDAVDEVPAGQKDWREAAFAGIGSEKPSAVEWAPSIEKNTLSITEEEAAALAKTQKVFSDTAATRGPEDWSKAIGEVFPETTPPLRQAPASAIQESVVAPSAAIPEPTPVFAPEPVSEAPQVSEPAPVSEVVAVPEVAPPASVPTANSWMAGAISPWEAEIQRATELAATWDSAKATPAAFVEESSATEAFLDSGLMPSAKEPVVEPAPPVPVIAEPEPAVVEESTEEASSWHPAYSAEPLLSPATEEVLQQETANVVAEELPALQAPPAAEKSAASELASVMAPNMDDIVAKVLAKMSPDALQAVTREILRPLVEAMIKDELSKK
jgi:CheY-like chemotaxis protein